MKEFWEPDRLYALLRPYVDFCTKRSYRKIEIIGELPPDGEATIFAPNHTNTLMDPLAVLMLRREGTVFGARADVFRNKTVASILHFLKMLPLARRSRDTAEEVARNKSTMQEIDRVLAHGMPFCIHCEGRHRTMHSLLPVRRGIATMAFTSACQRPTRIVPIGLDYSDWFHYRGILRIKIGEPMDVCAMLPAVEGLNDSERDAYLQNELYAKMSSLIFFIPDNENYERTLAKAESYLAPAPRGREVLQAILSFPLFAVCALLSLPMWATAEALCRFSIKDPAFRNTARFGVKLLGTPLMLIIWAVLFFTLLPWWAATALLLLFLPSYSVFYDWTGLVRGPARPLWKA